MNELKELYLIAESSAINDEEVIECNKLYQVIKQDLSLIDLIFETCKITIEEAEYGTKWLNIYCKSQHQDISIMIFDDQAQDIKQMLERRTSK